MTLLLCLLLGSIPFTVVMWLVTRALSGVWDDEFFLCWVTLFYGGIGIAGLTAWYLN